MHDPDWIPWPDEKPGPVADPADALKLAALVPLTLAIWAALAAIGAALGAPQ